MSAEAAAPRAPWYGFLYRVLGAHGTFWLWVLSVVAMWWTWSGALLRVLDSEPEHKTVAEVAAASDFHRWVALYGIELGVDEALFGRPVSSSTTPVPVLIDASDPAARFWHRVKVYASVDGALRSSALDQVAGALGELSLVAPQALREHARADRVDVHGKVIDFYTTLQTTPAAALPARSGAVLLLRGSTRETPESLPAVLTSASMSSNGDGPRPSPGNGSRNSTDLDAFDRTVIAWSELARTRVQVSFPTGLLDAAPRSVVERLERDPGLHLAPSALQVGRQPRDAELYVFCAASLLMVFLAAGLAGARRAPPKTT